MSNKAHQPTRHFDLYQFFARVTVILCLVAFLSALFSHRLPISSVMVIFNQLEFLRLGFIIALICGPMALFALFHRSPKTLYVAAMGVILYFIVVGAVYFLPLGSKNVGVSIWMQHHPRYGMIGFPSTCGRNWNLPDFDVTYCFDKEGWRKTSPNHRDMPPVLFLGCSFTFGTGVENDETFASRLASSQWPNERVVNAAFPSWGTTFAHRVLTDYLARDKPKAVFYCWIDDHLKRNGFRASWHKNLVGRNIIPEFELEKGKPLFVRNAPLSAATWNDSPETDQREHDLTIALIRDMYSLCQEEGIPFFFVAMNSRNNRGEDSRIVAEVRTAGIPVIDARSASDSFFTTDPHPTPEWHQAIAQVIATDPSVAAELNEAH